MNSSSSPKYLLAGVVLTLVITAVHLSVGLLRGTDEAVAASAKTQVLIESVEFEVGRLAREVADLRASIASSRTLRAVDASGDEGAPRRLDVEGGVLTDADLARLRDLLGRYFVDASGGIAEDVRGKKADVELVRALSARINEGEISAVNDEYFCMTAKQVYARLGKPTRTKQLPPENPYEFQWVYDVGGDVSLVVNFTGGLVSVIHNPL